MSDSLEDDAQAERLYRQWMDQRYGGQIVAPKGGWQADDLKEVWLAGYGTARFIWGLDEAQWADEDALLQHRYQAET